jgi:hypothetical protein
VKTDRFGLEGTPVDELFAGWRDGHYDLPADLIAQANAAHVLGLEAARAKAVRDEHRALGAQALRLRTIDGLVAAVTKSGKVPPDVAAPFVEARQAAEDAALRYELFRDAAERAQGFTEGLTMMQGDQIVRDYLRPPFGEVLEQAGEHVPALAGADVTSTASVSAAGAAAAAAFGHLIDLRARLDGILAAAHCVQIRQKAGATPDNGRFADTAVSPGLPHYAAAGPDHPLARLVWLAGDPDAQPWLPTLAERDARFLRWMIERRDETNAATRAAAGARA